MEPQGKHTPGPWKPGREDMQSYDGATGNPFSSVYADDERGKWHLGQRLPILVARIPGDEIPREEEKANARLIAAAPEMHKLLTMASHALRSYQYGNASTDLARDSADRIDALLAQIETP